MCPVVQTKELEPTLNVKYFHRTEHNNLLVNFTFSCPAFGKGPVVFSLYFLFTIYLMLSDHVKENLDSAMFDFDGESIFIVESHKMNFKSQVLVCQKNGKR